MGQRHAFISLTHIDIEKRYCFQQVNEKEEIKTAGKVWNNEYFAGFQNENVKEKSKADVKSFFSNYSAFRP